MGCSRSLSYRPSIRRQKMSAGTFIGSKGNEGAGQSKVQLCAGINLQFTSH